MRPLEHPLESDATEPRKIMIQAQLGRSPAFRDVNTGAWSKLHHGLDKITFTENEKGWFVGQISVHGPHVGLPVYGEHDSLRARWDNLYIDIYAFDGTSWKLILEDQHWEAVFGKDPTKDPT